jgi:hypothetical protein
VSTSVQSHTQWALSCTVGDGDGQRVPQRGEYYLQRAKRPLNGVAQGYERQQVEGHMHQPHVNQGRGHQAVNCGGFSQQFRSKYRRSFPERNGSSQACVAVHVLGRHGRGTQLGGGELALEADGGAGGIQTER